MTNTDSTTEATTGLVPHLDEYDGECDCGIEQVTPAEQQLLVMFDRWYGDKAYRKHDEIIGWADKLTGPLREELAAVTAERDEARADLDRARNERTWARQERDSAKRYVDQVCARRDNALSDRDAARRDAEQAQAAPFGRALEKLAQGIVGCRADDVHPDEEISVRWSRLRDLLAIPAATLHTVWDHYGPCGYCGVTTGPCVNREGFPQERMVPAPKPHPRRQLADNAVPQAAELPGMWEGADLTGGQTDAEPAAADGSGEQP